MKRLDISLLGPFFLFLLFTVPIHAGPVSTGAASKVQVPWQTYQKAQISLEIAQTPTLSSNCGAQSTIVGSDKAGVITMGPAEDGWNLGCTINFAEKFKTPACVIEMSGGQAGNGIRIAQTKQDSLLFHSYPYKFQGGESVMYQCSEADPAPADASDTPAGAPALSSTCGAQTAIVGSDKAGVITMGPAEDGWNLGCTITFAEKFKTPACAVSVSGGQAGNGIRIAQTKPDSLLFQAYPYKFQGGESVMYLCSEATP